MNRNEVIEVNDANEASSSRSWVPAAVAMTLLAVVGIGAFLLLRPSSSQSFGTVAEVISALETGKIGCGSPIVNDNDAEGIDAIGSCVTPQGDLHIWVFDDPGRSADQVRWDFLPLRNNDTQGEIFVVGANWVIKTTSEPLASQVEEVMGGRLHH